MPKESLTNRIEQFLNLVLQRNPGRELIGQIMDVVSMSLDVWTTMNVLHQLAASLFETHRRWKASSLDRRLLTFIRRLAVAGFLDAASASALDHDMQEIQTVRTA